jgi:hypothetical protein
MYYLFPYMANQNLNPSQYFTFISCCTSLSSVLSRHFSWPLSVWATDHINLIMLYTAWDLAIFNNLEGL